MEITLRIAELEALLADQRRDIELAVARMRATEAELDSLRMGSHLADNVTGVARTEAIMWALRSTGTSSSPSDLVRVLHDHGRNDTLRLVTATLAYLGQQERVRRESRRAVPSDVSRPRAKSPA